MNTAIIIAGGNGSRMNADIPKQYIEVEEKPIIVYTLEAFDRCDEIDAILVVSKHDWIDEVRSYGPRFSLRKLKWVIEGGKTGHLSIKNGLYFLRDKIKDDDLVIIHDAIRPFIPRIILNDLLRVARLKGNACASLPMHETMSFTDDQQVGYKNIPRESVRRIQTPQAYRYADLLNVHIEAEQKGIINSTYANTLMLDFGRKIYFSLGFDNNLKITTSEDLTLFKALLKMSEEDLVRK